MKQRPRQRRLFWLVFGSVWCIYLTTAGGSLGTGDAVAMYTVATSMIDRGWIDVPSSQSIEAWRGVDGLYYSPLGIGQPLFDVPFVLIGRLAMHVTGLSFGAGDAVPKAVVALASTIPAAAAVAFGWVLAMRLSGSRSASAITAFVLAFGTLLWPYSKFGFNAALAAAALSGGVTGLIEGLEARRAGWLAAAGASLGLAGLTRHEMFLAAGVCLLWAIWRLRREATTRGSLLFAVSAGVVVAGAVWLLLNVLRFGDPLRSGHEPALSWAGIAGFLFSPSGALWLYAPPAVGVLAALSQAARRQPATSLLLAVVCVMTAFYASLDDWLGTRSYGPRYLVPLLPLMVAPLALWLRSAPNGRLRFGLVTLCAISIAIQLPGVVVDFSRVGIAAHQPPQSIRAFEWRWAPLALNASAAAVAVPANARYLTGFAPVPRVETPATALADRVPYSLDFWWLYLFYLRVLPQAIVILLVLVPLALATAGALAVWRDAVQAEPKNAALYSGR